MTRRYPASRWRGALLPRACGTACRPLIIGGRFRLPIYAVILPGDRHRTVTGRPGNRQIPWKRKQTRTWQVCLRRESGPFSKSDAQRVLDRLIQGHFLSLGAKLLKDCLA